MVDLLFWLIRLPVGIALVIGRIVLIRRRGRSRKATGLALAALGGLAGWWLAGVVVMATNAGWGTLPPEWRLPVLVTVSAVREVWLAICLVLLVFAVLADRGGRPPTGPEADYADAREQ